MKTAVIWMDRERTTRQETESDCSLRIQSEVQSVKIRQRMQSEDRISLLVLGFGRCIRSLLWLATLFLWSLSFHPLTTYSKILLRTIRFHPIIFALIQLLNTSSVVVLIIRTRIPLLHTFINCLSLNKLPERKILTSINSWTWIASSKPIQDYLILII